MSGEPSIRELLDAAARRWIEEVDLGQPAENWRTTANAFLHEAERAYAAAVPSPPAVAVPPRRGIYLYRLWAADGRLLYVGITRSLPARLATHRRRWPDLWVRASWQEYPDEKSVLEAEREAIKAELPALNLAGV